MGRGGREAGKTIFEELVHTTVGLDKCEICRAGLAGWALRQELKLRLACRSWDAVSVRSPSSDQGLQLFEAGFSAPFLLSPFRH